MQIKAADKDLLVAINRLNLNTDFIRFRDYLTSELQAVDAELRVTKDDVTCRQLQGKAQYLHSLLKKITDVKTALKRLPQNH